MKKIISILIIVALGSIVVLQLMANKEVSENRIYHYDKQKPIVVHTETVKVQNLEEISEFTGTFEANKDAKINADLQGKIVAFYVDEGSVVKKGQSLIQLDDALLKLQLDAINVQIEGFETDVKRYKILTEADAIQGVKLEKTEMVLKAAEIQRNTLLEKISKTKITAPFNGVVTMKMSEIGSFAAPGVPLLMLTEISKLKFTVNVSENDLNLFELSDVCSISTTVYPDLILKGKVISIGSKGNRGNSFPVQIEVANTDDFKIKSKMFGKVILDGKKNTKGIIIPASTIVGSDIEPKVYVVENGKTVLRKIFVAKRIQNKVIISGGLNAGDILVTNGFINLFDGASILIKEK